MLKVHNKLKVVEYGYPLLADHSESCYVVIFLVLFVSCNILLATMPGLVSIALINRQ